MQRGGSQPHSSTSGSSRLMGALVSRTHWWDWGWKESWQQKTHSSSLERELRARLGGACGTPELWTKEGLWGVWEKTGWGQPRLLMGPLSHNKREGIRTCRVWEILSWSQQIGSKVKLSLYPLSLIRNHVPLRSVAVNVMRYRQIIPSPSSVYVGTWLSDVCCWLWVVWGWGNCAAI